jgi:hypothetical protein
MAAMSNRGMARSDHTADEFESLAKELASGVEALKAIAKLMRDNEMPSALVHGTSSQNRYVPLVLNWIEKTSSDVKMQLRAYLAGVQSDAERRKRYNENQKLAAAKKPWPKKSTKKKVD